MSVRGIALDTAIKAARQVVVDAFIAAHPPSSPPSESDYATLANDLSLAESNAIADTLEGFWREDDG